MNDTRDVLQDILRATNAKPSGPGQWRCAAVWRGGDGLNVTITARPDTPGGCLWHDFPEQEGGHGLQLAGLLGIAVAPGPPIAGTDWKRRAAERRRADREQAVAELESAERAAAEAREVWSRCGSLVDDAEAVAWLESRALCPDLSAMAGVRAAPAGRVPTFDHRRVVFGVYDCRGELVAVRGRATSRLPDGDPAKERGPKGHNGTHPQGRVYACPLAVGMLRGTGQAVALVRDVGILVCEGGPDWLTASTWFGDGTACEAAPAAIGIWGQSYAQAALERIPDGARVLLCPHGDGPGLRYMVELAAHLRGRCMVRVVDTGDGDLNDLLQRGGPRAVAEAITAAEVLS